jgi:hypothetical protein
VSGTRKSTRRFPGGAPLRFLLLLPSSFVGGHALLAEEIAEAKPQTAQGTTVFAEVGSVWDACRKGVAALLGEGGPWRCDMMGWMGEPSRSP